MRTVGIRELKNQLSAFIRAAQDGETILVTHRGEVVARLLPPEEAPGSDAVALRRLAATGKVRLGRGDPPSARAPLPVERPALGLQALLDDLRGDRFP